MTTKRTYLRSKDMLTAIKQFYGYELTMATLNRWRKRDPLPSPARLEELCRWFEGRMNQKRVGLTKTRRKTRRVVKRR